MSMCFPNWPVSAILVTVSGRGDPLAYGNRKYTDRPIGESARRHRKGGEVELDWNF